MTQVIAATAPGRCGIVGNPSDMYGGCVLSCTVARHAECRLCFPKEALSLRNGEEYCVISMPGDLKLRGDKLDVARATLDFLQIAPETARFSLSLQTEIPMRAGLAGSTALIAAIVGALDAFLGLRMNLYALAETTRRVEATKMGIVCGLQDQHMAVFGGLNFMDFAGKEQLEQGGDEPLATIEPLAARAPAPPLLLAHTGVQHDSGAVHRSPRERWLAGERAVIDAYAHLARLAQQAKRALVEGDLPGLGALMNENHRVVAGLGGSGPANDRLIEAARSSGAFGAKLAGAGGGGTIIALTNTPETTADALLRAGAESILYPQAVDGLTVRRWEEANS